MVAIAVLFVVGIVMRKKQPNGKQGEDNWRNEFVGLFIVFVLFFVAWGFGLPALHPLNLGVTRVVFQVILIVATIALGVVMLTFFCFLSPEIRGAWKCLLFRFVPGGSRKYSTREHRDVEDNIYMTDQTVSGMRMKEDAPPPDVSFTFTGNTFENPLASDYDHSKPSTGKKDGDGDNDSFVKMDLTAHGQAKIDHEITKL